MQPPVEQDGDGRLWSTLYEDVYFSRSAPLSEVEHVFIHGTDIEQKMLSSSSVTMAETGFGTGLNFLSVYKIWKKLGENAPDLHFISVDKHPLSVTQIEKALKPLVEVGAECSELLANYPPRFKGVHTVTLGGGRVTLTLMWGDAVTMYQALECNVDIWFLDGFAPSRNPDMWCDALYEAMAGHSAEGAVLASFTSAGHVRRGLEKVGFLIEKRPGFDHKREMITGRFSGRDSREAVSRVGKNIMPWFATEKFDKPSDNSSVVVIGGGIAGCSVAYGLSQRGRQVTIVERNERLALEASDQEQAIMFPALNRDADLVSQLSFRGYDFSRRWLLDYAKKHVPLHQVTRMLQLGKTAEDGERLCDAALAIDPYGDALAPISLADYPFFNEKTQMQRAILYDQAFCINMPAWCHAMVHEAQISVRCNTDVMVLEECDKGWVVHTKQGEYQADQVVIACAHSAKKLTHSAEFPLIKARGQLTYLPKKYVANPLEVMLSYGGYAIDIGGDYLLGATFDPARGDPEIAVSDHRKNISILREYVPLDDVAEVELAQMAGKVRFRTVTPDRLPLMGAVPDYGYYQQHYGDIYKGRRALDYPDGRYHSGLFMLLGLGARGSVYGPLLGDMLAERMVGGAQYKVCDYQALLHPARFWIRDFKRKKR